MEARLLTLLSKNSALRETYEIDFIVPWFRKKSKLFQDIETSVAIDVLRYSGHKKCVRDDIIIRQGDVGDCFYVIINGAVSIYIDSVMSGEEELAKEAKVQVTASVSTSAETEKSETESGEITDQVRREKKKFDRNILGRFIVQCDEGYSFGEIALLFEENRRNASIIADEDTELLTVHRDVYIQYLKAPQKQDFEERAHFVNHHKLFEDWTPRMKRLLVMSIRKEKIPYDLPIAVQGQATDGVMFITSGSAQVLVEPAKHPLQFKQQYPLVTKGEDLLYLEFPELRPSRTVSKSADDSSKVEEEKKCNMEWQVRLRRCRGYAAVEQSMAEKQLSLCSVQQGDVLGDVELICHLDNHLQSTVALTHCEVYVLERRNFDRLVRRHITSMEQLREAVKLKLGCRMSGVVGRKIPLLKHLHMQFQTAQTARVKKLPDISNSKQLPPDEELLLHALNMYRQDRAPLLCNTKSAIRDGGLFYRDLMRQQGIMRETRRQREQEALRKANAVTEEKPVPMATRTDRGRVLRNPRNAARSMRELREYSEKITEKVKKEMKQKEAVAEAKIQKKFLMQEVKNPVSVIPDCAPTILNNPAAVAVDNQDAKPREEVRKRFLRALVTAKLQQIEEQPEFADWDTSEETLGFLEKRVSGFLDKVQQFTNRTEQHGSTANLARQRKLYLPTLKRYTAAQEASENEGHGPKPGGKVLVRKSVCPAGDGDGDTKKALSRHFCERTKIVETIPEMEHYNNVQQVLNFFMLQSLDKKIYSKNN